VNRLNKQLVLLGLASSRRKAEDLIKEGLVSINGETVTVLSTQVSDKDHVKVIGLKAKSQQTIYVAFNKPAGYVCTHKSQFGQKTIFDLLPRSFASLKIAGRLDRQSQGLMILSSDGDFIQKLSHPSHQYQKTYLAWLDKPVNKSDYKCLGETHYFDGKKAKFDRIAKIKLDCLKITLSQGINLQVRRTFDSCGYKVLKLERTKMAKLNLANLPVAKHKIIQLKDIL
jgi:23S rRNA pseudouridine2605 synthase